MDKAPGVQHARINLATAYMNDGRFQDALAELSKVLASLASNTSADSDKKARAHGLMGECFYIQGDFDKALMHYRESIKYVPNSHQFYYRIAEIMRQREAFPLAAEDAIKKAIALKNDVANYHLTYSRLLLKKKSTNLAKKEVKIALMLNPDSVDAYKIMAEIMKQERRDLLAEHFARIALMKERQQ